MASRKSLLLSAFAMLSLVQVATIPGYNLLPDLGIFLILLGIPGKGSPET